MTNILCTIIQIGSKFALTLPTIIALLLPQKATAQTYDIYVGQIYTLPSPTPPAGSVDAIGVSSCSKSDYVGTSGLQVKVHKYFSGTATVTVPYNYTYMSNGKRIVNSATAYYTIKSNKTKVTLNKTQLSAEVGDDDFQFEYETTPSGLEPIIDWESSNENVAKFYGTSYPGLLQFIGEGTCTITAKGNTGYTDPTCTITVIDNYWVKADQKSGVVDKGTKVTLTCTKSGANIFYTTDGTEPTNSSTRYTNPIEINKSLILKAKAYLGKQQSKVTTREYKVYAHKAGETFKVTTVEGAILTIKAYSSGNNVYLQVGDGLTSAINSNYSGKVTIPEYYDDMLVHDIAKKAFLNSNITSVVIPGTYPIKVNNNAFEGCKKLKQFTYKGNWTIDLYSESFKDCESLETFAYRGAHTINFLKTSNNVFQNCNNLKTIYCDGSTGPTTFNDNIFPEAVYNSATVYVKEGRVSIFQSTKGWKKFRNIKEIGSDDDILVTNISINATSATMSVGETKQLTATISPSNATNKSVTWSSSNSSVATVSSSGLVTAKSTGNATITCKANDGSGKYATCSITVKDSQVSVTSITLSPSSASLTVGDTQQLTATISPSNATNKSVTWSSSNSSVATVSSSGLVTAKSTGNATITCKANDGSGKYATCSITVKDSQVSVTSITLSPSSASLTVGDTQQLTATISPSNATNKSVTWSSSNSSVATVSSSGLVTAKSIGNATITVRTVNGLTAECKVTVINKSTILKGEITTIAACTSHTMIVMNDGTLWACGDNSKGTFGISVWSSNNTTPIKVNDDVAFTSVGYGHWGYTMILKKDGTLWGCGSNEFGQLGDGTTTTRSKPVRIMDEVAYVSAGEVHTMIIKKDGTLWACGYNAEGQLGDGTKISRSTPVKVMEKVVSVSAGGSHTMILKDDGTLWTCGWNYYGQLAEGVNRGDRTSPIKVMEGVASISAGGQHSMIIKNDGTLWACGRNLFSELGDGNNYMRAQSAIKVMEDVAYVSAADAYTMIIKNDGTLWGCGNNHSGQLGDGTTIRRNTYVKVMNDVASVTAGGSHTMILKKDGTVWACGNNENGQLGDGTNVNRTNPVKIAERNESLGITRIENKIKTDAHIYNLRGQRLTAPQKGINIIGGKKVIVK